MDKFEHLFNDCSTLEELFWSAYVVVGVALKRYAEGEIGSYEALQLQHNVSRRVAERGFFLGMAPAEATEEASTVEEGP